MEVAPQAMLCPLRVELPVLQLEFLQEPLAGLVVLQAVAGVEASALLAEAMLQNYPTVELAGLAPAEEPVPSA